MYGALVLFESEFVHVVAISFTALILTELLMVALTIRTWHWLMVVAEFFSLGCYLASLAFLNEYFGRCSVFFTQTFLICYIFENSGNQKKLVIFDSEIHFYVPELD